MANGTATNDPGNELMTQDTSDPGNELNLDQRDEVTPEDHLGKMKLAMLANEAMRREESSLQDQWPWPSSGPTPGVGVNPAMGPGPGAVPMPPAPAVPTLPPGATPTLINRGGQQYTGSPLPQPTGQGRMYMGPAMTPSQESSFMLSPAGTRMNLMPPAQVTPPDDLTRLQAADRLGERTVSIEPPNQRLTPNNASWTPAYEQWAAQQDIKADIEKGVTPEQALLNHPAAVTGTAGSRPKLPPRWVPTDSATGAPGHFETGTGTVHIPAQERANRDPVLLGDITDVRKKIAGVEQSVAKADLTEEQAKPLLDKYQADLEDKKSQYYGTSATRTKATLPQKKPAVSKGKLSKDQARPFLKQAGGDKDKARKLALEAGYTF